MTPTTNPTPPEWEFTRFSKADGSPIKTIADVAETTAASAHHSELAELWGVTMGDAIVCYTGNGPSSKKHAQLITSLHNSHSTLTSENARLKERVKVLGDVVRDFVNICDSAPPVELMNRIGDLCVRARSLTTPEVGE